MTINLLRRYLLNVIESAREYTHEPAEVRLRWLAEEAERILEELDHPF